MKHLDHHFDRLSLSPDASALTDSNRSKLQYPNTRDHKDNNHASTQQNYQPNRLTPRNNHNTFSNNTVELNETVDISSVSPKTSPRTPAIKGNSNNNNHHIPHSYSRASKDVNKQFENLTSPRLANNTINSEETSPRQQKSSSINDTTWKAIDPGERVIQRYKNADKISTEKPHSRASRSHDGVFNNDVGGKNPLVPRRLPPIDGEEHQHGRHNPGGATILPALSAGKSRTRTT